MQALLLVGHGSLRLGSGAAMIRLAARLREASAAPLVAAGFLNYSRPTLAEALGRLVARGATAVRVLPYFLIAGYFTQVALPRALDELRTTYPGLALTQAAPLGAHANLAALVCKRAVAAGASTQSAVLLAAHGSPDPAANAPIHAVAAMVAASASFASVAVCYLGLNAPDILSAIAAETAAGHAHVVVVPYLLQLGGHAAADMPVAVASAQARHPQARIQLAAPLGYDLLLRDLLLDQLAGVS